MLRRLLVVLLLLAAVLVGVIELTLPGVASRALADGLKETLGTGETMTVRLKAHPSLRMLAGHFDSVTVVSAKVPVGSLTLDELAVTLEEVSVNMRDLLARKGLQVSHSGRVTVVITISESSLERYLLREVAGFGGPRVLLTKDGVQISGEVTVAGKKTAVSFIGRFELADEHWVRFVLTGVRVGDATVPAGFLDAFLDLFGRPEMGIDLERFPVPLRGTAVRTDEAKLVIEGTSP